MLLQSKKFSDRDRKNIVPGHCVLYERLMKRAVLTFLIPKKDSMTFL